MQEQRLSVTIALLLGCSMAACGGGAGTGNAQSSGVCTGACGDSSTAEDASDAGDPASGDATPSEGALRDGMAGETSDAACPPATIRTCVQPAPSYSREVVPILSEHCSRTCHSLDGGEWPLTDYAHVADWSLTIAVELEACAMPPPNAGSLSATDRAVLLDWIACGDPNN